jgi:hypothetical protein
VRFFFLWLVFVYFALLVPQVLLGPSGSSDIGSPPQSEASLYEETRAGLVVSGSAKQPAGYAGSLEEVTFV